MRTSENFPAELVYNKACIGNKSKFVFLDNKNKSMMKTGSLSSQPNQFRARELPVDIIC